MRYLGDLLGPQSATWHFGKAIVRRSHVSTMFHSSSVPDGPLEIWVSATPDGSGGWLLSNSEIPERLA